MLATRAVPRNRLVQEIDIKLLEEGNRDFADPLLLAVSDLQRMRYGPADSWAKPITRAELESQRRHFAGHEQLFDYLRAAEAYFVRQQPREVLRIIPDAARTPRFSNLQFSRQMLRGAALQALGDSNARGFFAEMLGGSAQPLQRDAVELALAITEERSGRLSAVFGPGLPVRNPSIREILLTRTAGPDLLRRQATGGPTQREREAALYILLAKELGRGLYADFLKDVRLVPPGAPASGYFVGAEVGTGFDSVPIPNGVFARPPSLGE